MALPSVLALLVGEPGVDVLEARPMAILKALEALEC